MQIFQYKCNHCIMDNYIKPTAVPSNLMNLAKNSKSIYVLPKMSINEFEDWKKSSDCKEWEKDEKEYSKYKFIYPVGNVMSECFNNDKIAKEKILKENYGMDIKDLLIKYPECHASFRRQMYYCHKCRNQKVFDHLILQFADFIIETRQICTECGQEMTTKNIVEYYNLNYECKVFYEHALYCPKCKRIIAPYGPAMCAD